MNNDIRKTLNFSFLVALFSFFTLAAAAQSFSLKDRLGKWQSTNPEKKLEFIFIDSSTLQMKQDGNPALNNLEFDYTIDTLKNQKILTVHYPNGAMLKLFLWVKSEDEFKTLAVDIMNYKDPLKKVPDENNKNVITFKKVHNFQ